MSWVCYWIPLYNRSAYMQLLLGWEMSHKFKVVVLQSDHWSSSAVGKLRSKIGFQLQELALTYRVDSTLVSEVFCSTTKYWPYLDRLIRVLSLYYMLSYFRVEYGCKVTRTSAFYYYLRLWTWVLKYLLSCLDLIKHLMLRNKWWENKGCY
jgi:hypothetical protein